MIDSNKKLSAIAKTIRNKIIAIMVLLVFCTGTVFATVNVTYDVEVIDGDQRVTVSTSKADAQGIIEQVGIELGSEDKLDLSGFTGEDGSTIKIVRAKTVTVDCGEGWNMTFVCSGTVKDAVEIAKLGIDSDEKLNYSFDTELFDGMVIMLYKTMSVKIVADRKTYDVTFTGRTVRDAVEQSGIKFGKDDETEPSLDTDVKDGMTIKVSRVNYSERRVTTVARFETITRENANKYENQRTVLQKGVDGKKVVTYRDKYVNGRKVETKVASEQIIEDVQNKIIEVGTKKVSIAKVKSTATPISELKVPSYVQIDANGVPKNYKSYIDGKASAYTGDGSTSTGKKPMPGYIAVDPREIPYGTEMWIVSADGSYVYGYCIAADTGGFIYKDKFTADLYMNTESECIRWGARDVRIYILK